MGALTDTKLRNLKPRQEPYQVADGEGLVLKIRPGGQKAWPKGFVEAEELLGAVVAMGRWRIIAPSPGVPPIGLISNGPHPSKHTTAACGGQCP